MAKDRLKLPHIPRSFNAYLLTKGLGAGFFGLLATFFLTSLFTSLPQEISLLRQAEISTMINYRDPSSHLFLVQEYLKRGNLKEIERELLLLQDTVGKNQGIISPLPGNFNISYDNTVLGTSLSPIEILARIKGEPDRIRSRVSFWEEIIEDKPDYRDAYLQLAQLNYQLYDHRKARESFEKALALDPDINIEGLKELLKNSE